MLPLTARTLIRRLSTTASQIPAETITAAANSLLQRPLPAIRDWISPQPSHLLSLTLSPYLRTPVSRSQPCTTGPLPPGHHLVYFPPQLPEGLLLPDGSDAEQSPGPLWPRRMWAGGSIAFSREPLMFFDEAVLRERVESVQVKGDKLFVWFERNMFRVPEGVGEPAIAERRCLVFFPQVPHTPATQILRPRLEPDFCESFTPTGHLLMRFSALTFNAHRIHYDSVFSREIEGYRGNLCHGPLAVVFLLGLLRRELPGKRIKSFEYKCLAPMYVDEKYKIAGKEKGDGKVELWAETPEGGLSVRGVAEVEDVKEGFDGGSLL